MKISVVLSTYNGSRYIEEQLESIRKQSLKADEVIISDDCSEDETVDIIKEYIRTFGLNSWRLLENEINKGWKRNFKEALQIATGDIIFLCDQDDIWNLKKLEVMFEIIQANNKILLLVSNYKAFYGDSKPQFNPMHLQYMPVRRLELEKTFLNVRYPGCVYCFRRDLLRYYANYSWDEYPHDAFLWRTALLLDGLYYVDFISVLYRRHNHTATGHEKRTIDYKLNTLHHYNKVIEFALYFLKEEEVPFREKKEQALYICNRWCDLRMDLLNHRRFRSGIKLLHYIENYSYKKTFIFDLFAAAFPKMYNRIVSRIAER